MEFHAGDRDAAQRIALDALTQARGLDNVALCVFMLDFIAAFTVADDPVTSVQIAGAADALRDASGGGMRIADLNIESARSAAARSLPHHDLEQAWAQGRAMTLEQAMEITTVLQPVSIG